jgi:transaldolase
MKFFADTADTAVLRDLMETGMLDGVTTNPSIIAKSGRDLMEVIREICAICPGPVSAEVVSADAPAIIAEGRKLAALAENVVIKAPLTRAGLIAVREFTALGLKTNVTLCFSVNQALLAAKAGATFVSPFIGRLDDNGADGVGLIRAIRELYDAQGLSTEILAASIRRPEHVAEVALAGADCATIPPAIFAALYHHPLTDAGLAAFTRDWASTGQSIL